VCSLSRRNITFLKLAFLFPPFFGWWGWWHGEDPPGSGVIRFFSRFDALGRLGHFRVPPGSLSVFGFCWWPSLATVVLFSLVENATVVGFFLGGMAIFGDSFWSTFPDSLLTGIARDVVGSVLVAA